jgi:hypothetical protein
MRDRSLLGALLLVGMVLPITSCSVTPALTSITVSPASYTTTLVLTASGVPAPTNQQGQTQLTATGYYTRPGHTAVTRDLTGQVTWLSYTPELVTVDANGVATVTGGAIGNTQITASAPGFHGDVISNASTFIVTAPAKASTTDFVTLTITPADPTIIVGQSAGFTAIGTTGTGATQNLTLESTWTSSSTAVCAIVATTGNCATTGAGTAAITATYTNADGIPVTGYTVLNVQVLGQQNP